MIRPGQWLKVWSKRSTQQSDALTLIEVLDQLRDGLMDAYGEQIELMLKEAQAQTRVNLDEEKNQTLIPFDDDPF